MVAQLFFSVVLFVLYLWLHFWMVADYLVTKCGVLMMSLFVFFTTTMSVSFTLRETQTRMLKFTGLPTELDVKYDHDPESCMVFAGLRHRSHPFSQSDSQFQKLYLNFHLVS